MTYDINLVLVSGEEVKNEGTPMAILGSSYGNRTLDFAKKYIFSDKELTPKMVRLMGVEFHTEFSKWCRKITGTVDFFGSSSEGYYFYGQEFSRDEYAFTIRLLGLYMTAIALECGLRFK